jgi:hypothetical protein
LGKLIQIVCYVAVACACWYFGDWHVLWGDWLPYSGNYALDVSGCAFRVNDSWYGVYRGTKFFDSAALQWGMLGGVFCSVGGVVKAIE